MIAISDPSLADHGEDRPVLKAVESFQKRYPGARIIGSAEIDYGASHTEDVISLPGVETLFSEGWPTEDTPDWVITGDLQAVLDALGITPEILAEEGIELHDEPRYSNWSGLSRLVQGLWEPWGRTDLQMSVFWVQHTEDYVGLMEEIWLNQG
ncbi:DUF6333 family protein [Streptomyces decoyicus]|uniref:DUF6333 family protein n=1 Tax=Streptomyces decoyicus TaxID=249567 RepID=UPI0036334A0C